MISVAGEFVTTTEPAEIVARSQDPERLASIRCLTEVRADGPACMRVVLTPRTPLGGMPLQTAITTGVSDLQSHRVVVRATRGAHRVDVDLNIRFKRAVEATHVSWTATVCLGGTAASVAQRVAPAIARSSIEEILLHLASAE